MNLQGINNAGEGAGTSVLSGSKAKFADNPFLKFLVAQMQTQTPFDAVDNDSFMQQVSNLSSMEEQRQLNDNLLTLLQFQGALAKLDGLTQGADLIGKEVEFEDAATGSKQSGVVKAVRVDADGNVRLAIGDREIGIGQVVGITAATDNGDKKGKGSN